jgi:predicted phage terminase large subunit-like protein
MQRCHENDLTGYLLAEEGGFEHLRLPARYESDSPCSTSIGFRDPRTHDGELLAPERFPEAEVVRLEHALGSYASAAQLQQRPSPRGGGIFKRDCWQYYISPPAEFDLVIDSWDMAFKDLKTSSFVCGQKWGFCGANRFLLASARGQWSFTRTCQEVVDFSEIPPVSPRKYVEGKANGTAVLDALKDEVSGLLEFNPNTYGSKEARAAAISPQQEAKNVYLPQNAPWVKAFVEEADLFPFGRWNDQVDTMSQALIQGAELLKKMRKRQVVGKIVSMTRASPWRV